MRRIRVPVLGHGRGGLDEAAPGDALDLGTGAGGVLDVLEDHAAPGEVELFIRERELLRARLYVPDMRAEGAAAAVDAIREEGVRHHVGAEEGRVPSAHVQDTVVGLNTQEADHL